MGVLSREVMRQILEQSIEEVEIPQAPPGTVVKIRMLTSGERDDFDASLTQGVSVSAAGDTQAKGMNLVNLRGRLLALAVIEPEMSAEEWRVCPSPIAATIFERVQKLNGMLPKAVEDAVKNSASAPSADSSSN